MAKRQGNKDRMTFNFGHDVAKTRLSAKIKASGFDIYAVRNKNFYIRINFCSNAKIVTFVINVFHHF